MASVEGMTKAGFLLVFQTLFSFSSFFFVFSMKKSSVSCDENSTNCMVILHKCIFCHFGYEAFPNTEFFFRLFKCCQVRKSENLAQQAVFFLQKLVIIKNFSRFQRFSLYYSPFSEYFRCIKKFTKEKFERLLKI
jgi:hypothetical protein